MKFSVVSFFFFFFKQKTAYEMRISDWSSDVCSSDLVLCGTAGLGEGAPESFRLQRHPQRHVRHQLRDRLDVQRDRPGRDDDARAVRRRAGGEPRVEAGAGQPEGL